MDEEVFAARRHSHDTSKGEEALRDCPRQAAENRESVVECRWRV